jgi:hypothetical protein
MDLLGNHPDMCSCSYLGSWNNLFCNSSTVNFQVLSNYRRKRHKENILLLIKRLNNTLCGRHSCSSCMLYMITGIVGIENLELDFLYQNIPECIDSSRQVEMVSFLSIHHHHRIGNASSNHTLHMPGDIDCNLKNYLSSYHSIRQYRNMLCSRIKWNFCVNLDFGNKKGIQD